MRALVVARLSQLVACPHSATFSHKKSSKQTSVLPVFEDYTCVTLQCNALWQHFPSVTILARWWTQWHQKLFFKFDSLDPGQGKPSQTKINDCIALIANNQLKYPEGTWVLLCWHPAGKTLNSNRRYPY